jgi:hypothetical protein
MNASQPRTEPICIDCQRIRLQPLTFGAVKIWCVDGFTHDFGFPHRRLSECPNAEPKTEESP